MRRKDREVTDKGAICKILMACRILRIGLRDGEDISIVPLNFGYAWEEALPAFYFHSASKGHKIVLLAADPRAAFELDAGHGLVEGSLPCDYSFTYASVMGSGRISAVEEPEAKLAALIAIMNHQTGGQKAFAPADFNADVLARTSVFKLQAERLSCKANKG